MLIQGYKNSCIFSLTLACVCVCMSSITFVHIFWSRNEHSTILTDNFIMTRIYIKNNKHFISFVSSRINGKLQSSYADRKIIAAVKVTV